MLFQSHWLNIRCWSVSVTLRWCPATHGAPVWAPALRSISVDSFVRDLDGFGWIWPVLGGCATWLSAYYYEHKNMLWTCHEHVMNMLRHVKTVYRKSICLENTVTWTADRSFWGLHEKDGLHGQWMKSAVLRGYKISTWTWDHIDTH